MPMASMGWEPTFKNSDTCHPNPTMQYIVDVTGVALYRSNTSMQANAQTKKHAIV
jgi:hypothetical protein